MMSKRVPILKRATPRMKYVYMNHMMVDKAQIKEHQARYQPEVCSNPECGKRRSLPLYLVGKTTLCFSCYEDKRDAEKLETAYAHIDELAGSEPIKQTDYDDIAETIINEVK